MLKLLRYVKSHDIALQSPMCGQAYAFDVKLTHSTFKVHFTLSRWLGLEISHICEQSCCSTSISSFYWYNFITTTDKNSV